VKHGSVGSAPDERKSAVERRTHPRKLPGPPGHRCGGSFSKPEGHEISRPGARILAEIGDDRSRFAAASALKAYAGAAPITQASGKSCTVLVRRVKNNRLAADGCLGVLCPDQFSRGPGTLLQAKGARRQAHRGPTQPLQPTPRMPPLLPANPPALRRIDRIPSCHSTGSCLTR
jgi:hypothetical protein